jgi:hypothetical protein
MDQWRGEVAVQKSQGNGKHLRLGENFVHGIKLGRDLNRDPLQGSRNSSNSGTHEFKRDANDTCINETATASDDIIEGAPPFWPPAFSRGIETHFSHENVVLSISIPIGKPVKVDAQMRFSFIVALSAPKGLYHIATLGHTDSLPCVDGKKGH